VVETPVARTHHGKDAVKAVSSAGAHSKKASGSDDPFAGDADAANEPKAAAPSGKSKSASESAAAAKGETEPKSAKSQDSLDNLMAGGAAAEGKGKKRDNKDLDALLKDVQMGKSEPAPKHEAAPAPASALSPADISRVMAGVKVRGNACAQRLGQKGIAELKITVGKDGHVTDVNVGGKIADTPLATCIDKATRAATFPASTGLKFDYRIDVR
jgi:outer membrane biosynthesis protein TonB